jgi:hypothetical protein
MLLAVLCDKYIFFFEYKELELERSDEKLGKKHRPDSAAGTSPHNNKQDYYKLL